jgi:hypothetical protein
MRDGGWEVWFVTECFGSLRIRQLQIHTQQPKKAGQGLEKLCSPKGLYQTKRARPAGPKPDTVDLNICSGLLRSCWRRGRTYEDAAKLGMPNGSGQTGSF